MELQLILSCCLAPLLLLPLSSHVGAQSTSELSCTPTVRHDKVLDTEASDMRMLISYRRETMEECMAGCCNQEWRQDVDEDAVSLRISELAGTANIGQGKVTEASDMRMLSYRRETMEECVAGCSNQEWRQHVDEDAVSLRNHCNLVTYYDEAPDGVNNCFMVMCRLCEFSDAEGFQFAWVHEDIPLIQSQPSLWRWLQSPWQQLKGAISYARRGLGSPALLQRARRSVDRRADSKQAPQPPKVPTTTKATTTTAAPPTTTTVNVTQQHNSSSTAHPIDLIIADDSVTLNLPNGTVVNSSVSTGSPQNTTTPTQATTTTKSPVEPPVVTVKVVEQPASAPAIAQNTTNPGQVEQTTADTAAQQTTADTAAPQQGTTKATLPTAPAANQTEAQTTTTPQQTAQVATSSAKLHVSTGVKTTPAAPPSTKGKEKPPTTKPVSKMTTVTKTTPKREPSTTTTTKMPASSPKSSLEHKSAEMDFVTEIMGTEDPFEGGSPHKVFTFHTNNFLLILSLAIGILLVIIVAIILLILSLAIGILLVIIVAITVGKRWHEAYQRRHYNKVDYLINGMYS